MEKDKLRLFNLALVEPIRRMNDDELWNFLLENEDRIKFMTDRESDNKLCAASGFLYAYPHGIDWFKKQFFRHIEDYREGVIYSTVIDFCFDGEEIELDCVAKNAFLDSEASCDVIASDDIMPPVDEDSEVGYFHKKYFHLFAPSPVEIIIEAMEKNFDKLEINTREDIDKVKQMKNFCLENAGWKVAFIFQFKYE